MATNGAASIISQLPSCKLRQQNLAIYNDANPLYAKKMTCPVDSVSSSDGTLSRYAQVDSIEIENNRSNTAQSRPDFFPHINGLRSLAMLSVLYSHYWGTESEIGHLGVRLFSVISGFLITGILLRVGHRQAIFSLWRQLKPFYTRRVLRIVPAYVMAIAISLWLQPHLIAPTLLWHLTFTTNFLFALNNNWDPWPLAQFWSLSVQEQFYLLWPLVLVMVPARRIPLICALCVVIATLYRFAVFALIGNQLAGYVLLPAAIDALAAGALLAVARAGLWRETIPRWFTPATLALCLLSFSIWLFLPPGSGRYQLQELALLMPLTGLVWGAAKGLPAPLGNLLANRPVQFVGQISYGIYAYHLIPLMVVTHWSMYFRSAAGASPARFVVCSVMTLGLATTSWFVLEQPINRLKRHFPYIRARAY